MDRGAIRRQRIFGVFYLVLAAIAAFVLPMGIDSNASTSFGLKPAGSATGLDIPNLVVPTLVTLYGVAVVCAAPMPSSSCAGSVRGGP